MRRVIFGLVILSALSTFAFAEKGFFQISGGLGTYAYFSPAELGAFQTGYKLNFLEKARIGMLLDFNVNLSASLSLGAETGLFLNCDMSNLAYQAFQFDVPLYAIMRIQPGLLFLQPHIGVIFDMTKVVPGSPLATYAEANDVDVPENQPLSLKRFSVDLGGKIGISLGGLAVYGDLGLIYDTFDRIGKPGFEVRLGAGLLFGV